MLAAVNGAQPQPPGAVTASPYRGLAAFEEQHAAFFFGREAATTELLSKMSRHLQGTGLLVVSGVSGSGKSSLLQAGVLPWIRGAGLSFAPESAQWPCLVFTPTRTPLDELALRVAVLAGADAAAVRRGLDADPEGFALAARQAALRPPPGPRSAPGGPAADQHQPHPQPRLLLVVDQFEQLFTHCADEEQRQAFITALRAAAGTGHGPDHAPAALVVLGVRADFEARCADYPPARQRGPGPLPGDGDDRAAAADGHHRTGRDGGSSGRRRPGPGPARRGTRPSPRRPPARECCRCYRTPWTRRGGAGPARRSRWPTMNAPAASKAPSPTARNAPIDQLTPAPANRGPAGVHPADHHHPDGTDTAPA